jgi:hypothetical protein
MSQPIRGSAEKVLRKQSRATRARGKAGQRAVEAALEAANLVVQRVESENDIGRDAFVDIVHGTDVTGGVISIQVKSGKSFHFNGQWVVPGKPEDFTLWRESTVPFFGIVHDPETGALRWVDLSYVARVSDDYLAPVVPGPYGKHAVPVPEENRLDLDVEPFLRAATSALRRRSGLPTSALLATDPETVEVGIADTFAVGRHDPDAFLLLAALFHRLPEECQPFALRALARATDNPDIGWSRNNWIPDGVKRIVEARCRWTGDDLEALLGMIDENGIQRGTIGQVVFHVLELDQVIDGRLFNTATNEGRSDMVRFWASVVLLYRAGEDAPELLERLLTRSPGLAGIEYFDQLEAHIDEWGAVSLF